MIRILFHAINKVGLGHVVRLSGLQRRLQREGLAECRYFTSSAHVHGLFTCPGSMVEEDPTVPGRLMARQILEGLWQAVERFQPGVVVCDTYWPRGLLARIRDRGIRTVLVQRMMRAPVMDHVMREAVRAFDSVVVPHHPHEVSHTYRNDRALLRYLESLPVGFIGPLARTAPKSPRVKQVIFTVGGGGEWPRATAANRIPAYVRAFCEASMLLMKDGHPRPIFAAGPLMQSDLARHADLFTFIETHSLYKHFGPNTVVVSRGGYNTCWEAVAAGSRLVLCGTHAVGEDILGRCAFLEHEGLGRSVTASGRRIFDAIADPRTQREARALRRWQPVVNAGVPIALDEVLGGSFLRASELSRDARPASATSSTTVKMVLQPGPRVRNELKISADLHRLHQQGIAGRLERPGDPIPGFVPDYLSQLFSLATPQSRRTS